MRCSAQRSGAISAVTRVHRASKTGVNALEVLRCARDTRVPRPSLRARPLGELRTNLRLWETIAGSTSLFPACYLQGMAQLQRVAPSARASDHFLSLVVGLAVAAQRGRLGAGVKFREPGRYLGVLALEQAVAGKVALHQERPELVDVEHPDGLRQPQFLEPIDAGDALDAAPEQRAGAVSDRGEIDRVVGHEGLAIDLGRHSALADDDVAAGALAPAVEPLREAKRGGGGDGADGVAAVGIDRRRRRAVEVGKPERIACGRHAGAVLDGALVDALARGEDATAEIGDRADLKLAQVVGISRKGEVNGLEHTPTPPPRPRAVPIPPFRAACSR